MKYVFSAIALLIFIGYLAGNGSPSSSTSQRSAQSSQKAASSNFMQDILDKVVDDAEREYQMARRGGSEVDICVHAGMVAAAYLQAHDQSGYNRWKMREKSDCDYRIR
jgi:hypothetical protein